LDQVHRAVDEPAPAPQEAVIVPLQRRGPLAPGRPLTGGELPDDLVTGMTDALHFQLQATELPGLPRGNAAQAMTAAIGGVIVVVGLLIAMTVLGMIL
jgi:hypothetical protein